MRLSTKPHPKQTRDALAMAPVYLPDTAVASLAIGNLVYTYAQTVDVILIECKGTSSTAAQIYNYRGQSEIICYYEDDGVRAYVPKFPKMFPLLAAANIPNIHTKVEPSCFPGPVECG